MEIWIKGVLTAEDVLLAREYGCDGVIVRFVFYEAGFCFKYFRVARWISATQFP